jgi:hypothetical protein
VHARRRSGDDGELRDRPDEPLRTLHGSMCARGNEAEACMDDDDADSRAGKSMANGEPQQQHPLLASSPDAAWRL